MKFQVYTSSYAHIFFFNYALTCSCVFSHHDIAAGASRIYTVTDSLSHEIHRIYSIDELTCISEGQVTYTVKGKVLSPLPIISIFYFYRTSESTDATQSAITSDTVSDTVTNLHGLRIQSYRAYINNTPLFIAAGYDFTADSDNNAVMVPRRQNSTCDHKAE